MSGTRTKLMDATLRVLRDRGVAGASARTIATEAGVNQALVFYHFGSVATLLADACRYGTEARVSVYRKRFAAVASLPELLAVGRSLHEEERRLGNVAVLAQVLAGAQSDPALRPAVAAALDLWVTELDALLDRLLSGGPLAGVTDTRGLARAVAAAFIGLELYEGVDGSAAGDAFAALERIAVLAEVVEDLGPVARRALRARLRRAGRTA
ncbi:TetR/AcrR family transcriptional regulator [Actinocatenispora rupis]|uniref:TetR family transcriptional regulator n=1 Tax=Actinocatenispora rupis TaxID=519421 RepID=A0A8J3IU50_9ACTN|nr:TetR/AcrR family transcriptional regulator [Actinocatenispora rupis]GID09956.1 TetR family transcriptional regulator [Actinocatenispora rupis]